LSKKELSSFAWRAYKFSLKLAKQANFDLAHGFFSFPAGVSCLLLRWRKKIPFLVSMQIEDLFARIGKIASYLLKKTWKNAYFLVANKIKLRDMIAEADPQKEITIISKGIDVESFFSDKNKRHENDFMILCDCPVTPIRGVRFLVQAFKLLAGRYEQVRLVVIGEGNDRKSLMDLTQALDINDKVVFLGEIPAADVLHYYQTADVFVSPSIDEQADNGAFVRKALATGLSIVSTKVNGVEELVFEGENGLFVAQKSADDLAEKIEKILLNNEFKNLMEKNSLELAQKLSWENNAKQYFDLYTKTKNIASIEQ